MDDLISRQAAIDAMMKLQTEDIEAYGASIPEGFDGDRAVTALKALPSAQQWIPCSERMPTEEKDYIVTIDYGDEQHIGSDMFIIPKKGNPFWLISDHVVAWMEGPEPYRKAGSGDCMEGADD